MAEEEFLEFRGSLLRAYADELCESTGVTTEEAEAMADAHLEVPPDEFHSAVHIRDAATDESVGAAWMLVADADAFLMEFRIDAEYRGRGYGRAAMDELEGLARRGGAQQIRLHVFARNAPARALYERHGFEVVSLQMRKRIGPLG
jgi:ribosomal protein S18 acetylase RimI-like enzyme